MSKVQKHLIKKSVIKLQQGEIRSVLISLLIVAFGFIIHLFVNSNISHILPSKYYGDYTVFIQMILFFGLCASLGYDIVVDRYIPVFVLENKFEEINDFIKLFFNIAVKTIFISGVLITVYKIIFIHKFRGEQILGIENPIFNSHIYFLILGIGINLLFFHSRLIRSTQHPYVALFCYQALPHILFFIIIKSYYTFFYSQNIGTLLLMYTISWILSIMVTMFLYYKIYSKGTNVPKVTELIRLRPKTSSYFQDGYNLLVSNLLAYSFYFVSFLANMFLPSNKQYEVGFAGAIYTLTYIFFVLVKTFSAIYKPQMAIIQKYYAEHMTKYVNKMSTLCLIIAIILASIIFIEGKFLLKHFFGAVYIQAYSSLCVATCGFILMEGLVVYKFFLEQYNPKIPAKLALMTNILSITLITIGSRKSLFYAVCGFTFSRCVYSTFLIYNYRIALKKIAKNT